MNYFTTDNTEDFTKEQLEKLNQELENKLKENSIREDDLAYESDLKNLADSVLNDFSNEPEQYALQVDDHELQNGFYLGYDTVTLEEACEFCQENRTDGRLYRFSEEPENDIDRLAYRVNSAGEWFAVAN